MSDYALFQMSGQFRQSLIAGHLFYVKEAQRRLLSRFEDIDIEADDVGNQALERNAGLYDPEQDRQSVVEGKSGSVRVDLGGRRILKQNRQQQNSNKVYNNTTRNNIQ